MGRYRSSDSGSDYSSSKRSKRKRKERRRGRSRSSSQSDSARYSSSRHSRKSKKKHSQRSPSPDRRGGYSDRSSRRSRSRSRSYDRYGSRSRRRSRSRSYERKSSRRSRSPDVRRRSRSHSYSRDRRSRSGSRGRGSRAQRRSRSRSRSSERARSSRETSHSSVSQSLTPLKMLSMDDQKGSHRQLTMAEQAEERMRQALKAAAAADEKLRMDALRSDPRTASPDLRSSQKFVDSVAGIEADDFVPSSFKSSRSSKVKDEPDLRSSHDDAIFGSLSVSGFTLKPDPDNRPIDLDVDSIVHPSLFCDIEVKMDCWIERLAQLRRRKLEGEAMQ